MITSFTFQDMLLISKHRLVINLNVHVWFEVEIKTFWSRSQWCSPRLVMESSFEVNKADLLMHMPINLMFVCLYLCSLISWFWVFDNISFILSYHPLARHNCCWFYVISILTFQECFSKCICRPLCYFVGPHTTKTCTYPKASQR